MTCYLSLPSLVPSSAPYPWTPGATSAPRAVAGVPPPPRAARWPRSAESDGARDRFLAWKMLGFWPTILEVTLEELEARIFGKNGWYTMICHPNLGCSWRKVGDFTKKPYVISSRDLGISASRLGIWHDLTNRNCWRSTTSKWSVSYAGLVSTRKFMESQWLETSSRDVKIGESWSFESFESLNKIDSGWKTSIYHILSNTSYLYQTQWKISQNPLKPPMSLTFLPGLPTFASDWRMVNWCRLGKRLGKRRQGPAGSIIIYQIKPIYPIWWISGFFNTLDDFIYSYFRNPPYTGTASDQFPCPQKRALGVNHRVTIFHG